MPQKKSNNLQIKILLTSQNLTLQKYIQDLINNIEFKEYITLEIQENGQEVQNSEDYSLLIQDSTNQISINKNIIFDKPITLPRFLREITQIIEGFYHKKSLTHSNFSFKNFYFDLNKKIVIDINSNITISRLTEQESEIIEYLHKNKSRAIEKDEIIKKLWGYSTETFDTGIVSNAIYKLRKKLQDRGINDIILSTKDGYKLNIE